MVRLLYTTGNGKFEETRTYNIPDTKPNEIRVRAVMTGVCRSDIAMMNGTFGPLPLHMQGHEGLGQVIQTRKNCNEGVRIGDYVATRGEPGYADEYNVKAEQYVKVPEADPKWILEPVACGINCVIQAKKNIKDDSKNALILGSGFLAKIVYQTLKIEYPNLNIDVVGSSNKEFFTNLHNRIPNKTYDVIVDLKDNDTAFSTDCANENAVIIMATEKSKPISTDFSKLLWKACTIVFPSPRADTFYLSMILARNWILNGSLVVDKFWDRGYNRDTEWQKAFEDANNRNGNYGRGYIVWD
jgi:D-arabinose 1-dehydrogenase-like Zn-dependent alcohol dehydrogenase